MNNSVKMKKHMGMKAKSNISNTIIYIVLVVMMIVWMVPFFCLLCDSLKCECTDSGAASEATVMYKDADLVERYGWMLNYIQDQNPSEATRIYTNQCLISYGVNISTSKVTITDFSMCDKLMVNQLHNFLNKSYEEFPGIDYTATPVLDCTNEAVYAGLVEAANEAGYTIIHTQKNLAGEDEEVAIEVTVDNILTEFMSDVNASAKASKVLTDNVTVNKFYGNYNGKFMAVSANGTRITWQTGYILPKKVGLDNYKDLFTKTSFPKWFLNTFLVGLFTAILQTIIVLSMSYGLSRLRFKGRKFLMNVMLVLGMFPGFLTMILIYKLLSGWGMTESSSVFGLILVYCASSGMGYYVSKGFFDTIPRSLDEAARVDGATRFQVFYKIIMPMAKPIIIYTILTAFMAPWGDFMFASYVAHNADLGKNVAVGLYDILNSKTGIHSYYTIFCAGAIVVSIPITLLFMFLQRYYVEGVTGGAVKG